MAKLAQNTEVNLMRCVLVLQFPVLVSAAPSLSDWATSAFSLELVPQNEAVFLEIILLSLASHASLMALPFLPDAEIRVTLLTAFGGAIAPVICLAMVTALALAVAVGQLVPVSKTADALSAIDLFKGANLVCRLGAVTSDKAVEEMTLGQTYPARLWLAPYRYIALALIINLPVILIFGGGGGLTMAAGLSPASHSLASLLSVAFAVLPVPMAFCLLVGR